jgi:hypothetical protein
MNKSDKRFCQKKLITIDDIFKYNAKWLESQSNDTNDEFEKIYLKNKNFLGSSNNPKSFEVLSLLDLAKTNLQILQNFEINEFSA